MSRPANANAEETRQRLLEIASTHFSAHGVEGTSLRRVARDAGVSLATIHYYFGTKGQLYEACMATLYSSLAEGLAPMHKLFTHLSSQIDKASLDAQAFNVMLDDLVRDGFRFARQHSALLRLIMRPLVEHGEMDARWRESTLVPFFEHATRALAAVTGRPAAEQRFAVQSVVAVGMRYALSSPKELAQLNGLETATGEVDEAMEALAIESTADQLVFMARRMMLETTLEENQ
jgi:AcrR family transcriptional regulator